MQRAARPSPSLVSVNTGLPREVEWRGSLVSTGIFKSPVAGPVHAGRLNLDGDGQGDLEKHGGPLKAVYAYPAEHYDYWREKLPGVELPWGAFGENLTTRGLLESSTRIGDRLEIGSAEFTVTQPRMPCFKLGIRFAREDMVRLFLKSGRTGFYLSVTREGDVEAGNPIVVAPAEGTVMTVAEVVEAIATRKVGVDLLQRVIEADHVPEHWREYFRMRLASEIGELSPEWKGFFREKPWTSGD